MVDIKIDNRGKKWTQDEDKKLVEEYVTNKLDVNVIAKNHGRSPVAIAARLKQKGFIKEVEEARGYSEEINKDYKKILKQNKKEENKKEEIDVIETLKELQKSNKEMGIKIDNLLNLLSKKEESEIKLSEMQINNLRKELKSYRTEKAQKISCSPFIIFTNITMEEFIDKLPTTKEQLHKIKGVGPVKYELYGEDILKIIKKNLDEKEEEIIDEKERKRYLPIEESEEENDNINYEIVDETDSD